MSFLRPLVFFLLIDSKSAIAYSEAYHDWYAGVRGDVFMNHFELSNYYIVACSCRGLKSMTKVNPLQPCVHCCLD